MARIRYRPKVRVSLSNADTAYHRGLKCRGHDSKIPRAWLDVPVRLNKSQDHIYPADRVHPCPGLPLGTGSSSIPASAHFVRRRRSSDNLASPIPLRKSHVHIPDPTRGLLIQNSPCSVPAIEWHL